MKDATDGVGELATRINPGQVVTMSELQSDRNQMLNLVHETFGSKQVNRSQWDFAPSWIADEAFTRENDNNWPSAYRTIRECDVPRDANIIKSQVVYKLTTGEDGTRKLKGRLVPHGNRDDEKENLLKDSSSTHLNTARFLFSLEKFLNFRLGTADISGAYFQSGPIQREIFSSPPCEWKGKRSTLWRLLQLPFSIVGAGRELQKTVENWILSKGNLQRVYSLSQLFVRRNESGRIILRITKVTDEFLIACNISNMQLIIADLG